MTLPPLSEAEIKKGVGDWLQYQENLGKLIFLRLNSGTAYVKKGDRDYAIKLCPVGTADFVTFQAGFVQPYYKGQPKGQVHPICFVEFLEVKTLKGKTSKAQDEFAEKVRQHHCKYAVVRSVEEAEAALKH